MITKKEPYTYFLPGEMFYFISHESDKPINRTTGISKRAQSTNAESSSSENEKPINPEMGGPESDQSSDAEYDDDNDGDDNGDFSYDQKIDRLIDWSNKVAKEFKKEFQLQYDITISRDKKRELHFPGTLSEKPENPRIVESMYHGAFSLIPAQVRVSENDENWKKSDFRTNPHRYVPPSELAKLVVGLDDRRNHADQPLQKQGITLEVISPNWLSSPCSEYGGGGGPGGFPEPYQNYSVDLHLFEFPEQKSFQAALAQGGKGVTIAILDTAPSLKDLAAAYERHHKVDPINQTPINQVPKEYDAVFEGLLGPQGRLVVHPASIEELLRMRAVHLRDHNYVMTDHGLFVSSIAHRLAPEATIHLYEVLNHQGVGDLLSIAKGFWRVFICFSRDPLVVNCSLVVNIPLLNQPVKNLDPEILAKIINPEITPGEWLTKEMLSPAGIEWLARQGAAIQWICDHLYVRGSRVIAAAGNDRRPDENNNIRPQARYPAAFDSALGVGALPKGAVRDSAGLYPSTDYSNISDRPGEVGIATLGGEEGPNNGILGLYIGEFPDMWYRLNQYPWYLWPLMWLVFTISWRNCVRPKNKTDWAWWSGTSFSTPIVAGLVAAALGELRSRRPATTDDAIRGLYGPQGILPNQTHEREDGIGEVMQP